jgi:hypothetical protein
MKSNFVADIGIPMLFILYVDDLGSQFISITSLLSRLLPVTHIFIID